MPNTPNEQPEAPYAPRTREEKREERLEDLTREIAARLRPVCQNMPGDEFDRMVARIAAVELKYTYGY